MANSGIGLPVERDRMVDLHDHARRGTGLGLAIVKKIVEEHFGTIPSGRSTGEGDDRDLVVRPRAAGRARRA
ncbi:ATP-binding protein [Sphingomonas sp. MMS24-JH45]